MHTNFTEGVIIGIVKAVSVPWLSKAGSRLHLFPLHIQDGLKEQMKLIFELYFKKETKDAKRADNIKLPYLDILNHGGVLKAMALQVTLDRLQGVRGNSNVYREGNTSHTHPDVQLK